MNKPLIIVEELHKDFSSGNEVLAILKGLSFTLEAGVSMAIRGESGSGKSTLLNILGGLDKATRGRVAVGSYEIQSLAETALTSYRSHFVGFVFQFHYLLKDFTALENIMLPAFVAGLSKKEAMEKAKALLAEVKMDERAHHFPSQLSGGERQRVAVARSLVNDPELVLADEPTGNLDPANSAMVADILFDLASKKGKTLVVVTHDERIAARADQRFFLEAGIFSEKENG